MSAISQMMDEMIEAGATIEHIRIAIRYLEAEQAKETERREKRAAQKRKERATNDATVARQSPDNDATIVDVSQNVADGHDAYKDNHASAPVSSNGSSLRSEPELITPDLKIGPPAEEVARSARLILFERFCQAYPKRTNRKAANARFDAALRAGVDGERIIAAALRFAEACRRAQTEKQFIPAPDVWLNKGKYDDDDLPEANSRAGPRKGGGWAELALESLEQDREHRDEEKRACEAVQRLPGRIQDGFGASSADGSELSRNPATILIAGSVRRM
jgi:hypothetical protein